MIDLASRLPDGRSVWLRAFYGFGPENSGYIGFTREKQREEMLGKMRDGDLVLIYGAVESLTEESLRRQTLGFLEIAHEPCRDIHRAAKAALEWKNENGFSSRWTFGIKVRRAWRTKNRVHIKNIAPKAYSNENRFERTTRAILLVPDERERALSQPVTQVNVFGELEIPQSDLASGIILELLKPSRGVPPSIGPRISNYEDGENCLYLMLLDGGSETLLGRFGPHLGKALVKVGRSNDPKRRLKELNEGFPKGSICRWRLVQSQRFPDVDTAHRHETDLKQFFHHLFTSQENEFFTADQIAIESEFNRFCVERLPSLKGAPGKAKGVR